MELLNKTIAYWYDCIKNEDILRKDISINVRGKAVLYPFDNDPFFFDRRENLVLVGDEKLTTFSEYITTQGCGYIGKDSEYHARLFAILTQREEKHGDPDRP